MKIVRFEIENVKRVRLVRITPAESGLTVIGGANASGKTSVLDGIIYALGGEKYRPTALQNESGLNPARIRIELENGLVVERKGKNASLSVTDMTGKKFGQKLLDSFCEQLALNLPKFLTMRDEEKADVLLRTLGIEEKLLEINRKEVAVYNRRHDHGVITDQKKKVAMAAPEYPEVGTEFVDINELSQAAWEISARNAERAIKRQQITTYAESARRKREEAERLKIKMEEATREAARLEALSQESISEDEDASEIIDKIKDAETTNAKIRANNEKRKAMEEANRYQEEYKRLTGELESICAERNGLLFGVKMPLDGLTIGANSVGKPILLYKEKAWDCMSTSEQYKIAVAIIQKLKPECKFVLLDRLESFDKNELEKLDEWMIQRGLQAICTRVGSDDASIIIEDGYYDERTAK